MGGRRRDPVEGEVSFDLLSLFGLVFEAKWIWGRGWWQAVGLDAELDTVLGDGRIVVVIQFEDVGEVAEFFGEKYRALSLGGGAGSLNKFLSPNADIGEGGGRCRKSGNHGVAEGGVISVDGGGGRVFRRGGVFCEEPVEMLCDILVESLGGKVLSDNVLVPFVAESDLGVSFVELGYGPGIIGSRKDRRRGCYS